MPTCIVAGANFASAVMVSFKDIRDDVENSESHGALLPLSEKGIQRMRPSLRHNSSQWGWGVLFAVVLGALCALLVEQQLSAFLQQETERLDQELNYAAKMAADALNRGDYQSIQSQMEGWAKHTRNLTRIELRSSNDFPLAKYTIENKPAHILRLRHEVPYSGGRTAKLSIESNLDSIYTRAHLLTMQLCLGSLLLTALFIYLLHDIRRRRADAEELEWHSRTLLENTERLEQTLAELERSRKKLRCEKERAQVTLDSIAEAIIRLDGSNRVEFMNPASEQLIGWTKEEAHGEQLAYMLNPLGRDGRSVDSEVIDKLLLYAEYNEESTIALARPDGTRRDVSIRTAPLRGDNGKRRCRVVVMRDLSDEKRLKDELDQRIRKDHLTGLLNRSAFERELRKVKERMQDEHPPYSLCHLGLDRFTVLNETYGHLAGDRLLEGIGELLRKKLRGEDLLGRLGDDEFGILLHDCTPAEAQGIAEKLCVEIRNYDFPWDAPSYDPSASIGIAAFTANSDLQDLLANAGAACAVAKDLGRNRVHLYQSVDHNLTRRRVEMQWTGRIKQALQVDRFELHGQPIATVNGNDAVSPYCEVLLRMRDEQGELVKPGDFLPAAERYGGVVDLDRWVVKTTFELLSRRPENVQLPRLQACAINLSGVSLDDPSLLSWIKEQIIEHKISPQAVIFEITETAAIRHLERTQTVINELRALHCRFALDDFGSGASSFKYLRNFKVDFLKIDGQFVKNMRRNSLDHGIVQSIHQIGRAAGLETIAEYVEDPTLLPLLSEIGVDYAQGYGIARPQPLEQLLEQGVAWEHRRIS